MTAMNAARFVDYGWGPEQLCPGNPAKLQKAKAKRRTINKISRQSRKTNRRSL